MEKWQKQTIIQNLPELILVTTFNAVVKADLLVNNILTQQDVEKLEAESNREGKTAASYNYYQCLMTRVGAYEVLAKTLEENKQSGAVRILKDGLQKFEFPKQLDFNNVEIKVQGKSLKFNEFFDHEKVEQAKQMFRDTISDQDLNDSFIKKGRLFILATSSIPPEPPFYIPRFLSNRIEFDESIFKADCPDVFVFKNTISRHQLSEIVKPNSTDRSSSQLTKITSRFIYLDEFEDWNDLKKSAKVPIHLVNSDSIQQIYLLEDSTAALRILSQVGPTKQRVYLSEDEFVQQQLSEKVSSVCICDTPGMGKTFLLTNIARIMSKHCTRTIVVFIQLSTFVADFSSSSTNTSMGQDVALLSLLKYVSTSIEHADFVLKLVKAELIQVEIFCDGFDEISSDKVEWIKQILLSIISKLQNVKIYIASRPHIRHELEKSLGVIAYDIMPFNLENQVDYLVQFWSPNVQQFDQELLSNYARHCLKEINKTLTTNDREMAGIPLLCRLIAEVYANKVNFYSTTGTKNIEFPLKIAALYQQFIELRIKATAQNENELSNINQSHMWLSLKLIFPTDGFHHDDIFNEVNRVMASNEVFKAGLIQLQSNAKLEFIHRTFAEYFTAEYLSKIIKSTTVKPKTFFQKVFKTNDETTKAFSSIFNLSAETNYGDLNNITFLQSVVVSFVEFRLNEVIISEEIICRLASFCSSIATEKFFAILCSCCNQNLYNLFSFLTKAVTKWNWFKKKKYFTRKNCFWLLTVCIRKSTSQMFRICVQLLTKVLQLDLEQICMHDRYLTLLHRAAMAANYEAVECFVNRVSLELPSVLEKCVEYSYDNDMDEIRKRENILHLLMYKNPSLIQKTPNILATWPMHIRLFKMLVQFGASLTGLNELGENCAMVAARHGMSSSDFHEQVKFLLNDCKAEYLFLDHEKWEYPLPYIIEKGKLLPETLELLLNIPGVDINMKYRTGENLLFSAVQGSNVNNFQLLLTRGLDYKMKGFGNKSLLHGAAIGGKLGMYQYLLSLGMDPNSRDEEESTPLHYAAIFNDISVVEVLMENGANVHAKNIDGQTPLHFASLKCNYECRKIIMYLIRKGAEVNDRDNNGNTPLHLCKVPENKESLLEMGADVHAKNKKGETPAQDDPRWWK